MTYHKVTLPQGCRLVSIPMPHARSVSVCLFLGVGSRYESEEEAGLSHFLEHLCFKGSAQRPTAKEISEAIEGVGGVMNAGTDRELTVYWIKVARPHFSLALDVLADMVLRPRLDPAEIEKERQVVIEEINMTQDSPQQWVDILIDEVLWPDQPLGRDIAGTRGSVSAFDRPRVAAFHAQCYLPQSTVVSIAGDVDPEEVVSQVAGALGSWPGGVSPSWPPAQNGQEAPRLRLGPKKTEQAHLCLAVRGLSSRHPDRFALNLLNVLLGEGMSSRLFQELREERALCYDIHSAVQHYRDAGALIVYAGVDPKKAEDAIGAILHELARFKDGVAAEELRRAVEFAKGRMLLRLEETRSLAGWMGSQELLHNEILTVDDVIARLEAVTPQDLQRLARELFITSKLNLAVVGPFRQEGRFLNALRF